VDAVRNLAPEPEFETGPDEPVERDTAERATPDAARVPTGDLWPTLRDWLEGGSAAKPVIPPGPPPPADDVLRRERVLVPSARLRSRPAGPETGATVETGHLVDVLALEAGWKQVRVPGSNVKGYLPDDAATPDLEAPERMAALLVRLRPYLSPDLSGATGEALCAAIDRDELDPLVFAWLPEIHSVFVKSLWHALDGPSRDAFQIFAAECHDVHRIVDVASGDDLRDLGWGERPGSRAVPSPPPNATPEPL
jgi:hypothetical protein